LNGLIDAKVRIVLGSRIAQQLAPRRNVRNVPSWSCRRSIVLLRRSGLPFALSIVAGSVDVIGFLTLDGLFTAHITGNIVVLTARFVAGGEAPLSHLLAVPVFMLVLGLTRSLAAWLERARIPSLLPLLLLELLLLSSFLAAGLADGPSTDPNGAGMVCAALRPWRCRTRLCGFR
jgi:hypothetical protein